jgi:hypothetical protein
VLGDFAMDVLVYTNASATLNDTVVMNDPVALNDRVPMSANVALHLLCMPPAAMKAPSYCFEWSCCHECCCRLYIARVAINAPPVMKASSCYFECSCCHECCYRHNLLVLP